VWKAARMASRLWSERKPGPRQIMTSYGSVIGGSVPSASQSRNRLAFGVVQQGPIRLALAHLGLGMSFAPVMPGLHMFEVLDGPCLRVARSGPWLPCLVEKRHEKIYVARLGAFP